MTTATRVSSHGPELVDGVLTTWLPMSTAWPSSEGCESSFWRVVSPTVAAWDPGYGIFVQPGLPCLPPQVTSWWDAVHLSSIDLSETQISLGPVVCPEAYVTAATSVNAASSTFVACCPSNYKFEGEFPVGNTGQCVSEVHSGQVITFATLVNDSYVMSTETVDSSSVIWGIPVNGWLFPTSGGSASSTASSPSSSSSSTSTSKASEKSTSGGGLSTGAKAGIGIGAALGAIAIGAAVAAFLFRRRWQARARETQTQPPVAELTSNSPYKDHYAPVYQEQRPPSEMP